MKKIAFLLMLPMAQWASAYELSIPCKAADGWKVVQGQCDDNGLLQGIGAATQDPTDGISPQTMVSGPFKDGVPNGNMTLQFDLNWGLKSPNGQRRLEVGGACELAFVQGSVLNSALSCTATNRDKEKSTITVQPGAGKLVWAMAPGGRGSTLTIDLPEVRIDSRFSGNDSALLKPFMHDDYRLRASFAGKADVFVLNTATRGGESAFITIKNLSGALSNKDVEISGTFTAKCHSGTDCDLYVYRAARGAAAVDARSLIRVTPAGSPFPYEMVFVDDTFGAGFPSLLYFKDDQIEFDASTTRCEHYRAGAELLAKGTRFDIDPHCGKITPRNGRGYEGPFRSGRPIQP